MNDPVSRCTEVIKSRQIFSLSRRVSDTYIILKGLFRGALYPGRNEPRSRARHRATDALFFPHRATSLRKCVRELSQAISLVFVYTLASSLFRLCHRAAFLVVLHHPLPFPYALRSPAFLSDMRERERERERQSSLYER